MEIRRILVCTASTAQALAVVLMLRTGSSVGVAAMIILLAALFGLLSQHPRHVRSSIRVAAIMFSGLAAAIAGLGILGSALGALWSGAAVLPWFACMVLIFVASAVNMTCVAAQWQPELAHAGVAT